MGIKGHHQNRFVRFITIPFRLLGKTKDLYVRSMTSCAQGVGHSQSMGSGVALPKSFSVSSSRCSDDDDLKELIRAASTRTLVDRIDVDMILKQQAAQSAVMMAGSRGLPKSSSVGMGKIDEDRPCDFEEVGVGAGKADLFYPRSRSYAVTKRSVEF
ncbi:uncharacterized protein LOC132189146 [Corylus avellana]|uniref:uncharacterized protein LOC132189146 n=1 Tax=Corylus avellana TaxID=13451 RepID=UPI00286AFB73|nr:uncharacterized protein LOC132189146 [Corylus avellana]